MMMVDDGHNFPKSIGAFIAEALLKTGDAKGLTWKPTRQNVVWGDILNLDVM